VRVPEFPEPAGLWRIKARVAALRARFRRTEYVFSRALETAGQGHLTAGTIDRAITSAAVRHGLDPALLRAVAQVESGLRSDAVSPAGALGIMQLMPPTAESLGVDNPFDAESNLEGGARLLRGLIDRFDGDLARALAAYNAGPGAVLRHGGIPPYPETRRFVSRVFDLLAAYSPPTNP
jgi:soluble lytic murein transglycosylase-like protein